MNTKTSNKIWRAVDTIGTIANFSIKIGIAYLIDQSTDYKTMNDLTLQDMLLATYISTSATGELLKGAIYALKKKEFKDERYVTQKGYLPFEFYVLSELDSRRFQNDSK